MEKVQEELLNLKIIVMAVTDLLIEKKVMTRPEIQQQILDNAGGKTTEK